jgi:hypothetical protein
MLEIICRRVTPRPDASFISLISPNHMADARTCKAGATLEGLQMMRGTFLGETAYFQLGNILYNVRYQYGRLTGIFSNCRFNGNNK